MKMKTRKNINKSLKVGDHCICPSCNTSFVKESYQQVFCKTKPGTQCKDKFWNTVTPKKRNNTTRISPASRRFLASRANITKRDFDDEHPFSSEGLGQWID